MHSLRLKIPNRFDHVGLITRCVMELVREPLADDAGVFETAVGEAVNNVIEHSYPQDAEDTVDVHLRFDAHRLILQIEDRGRGMDPDAFHRVPAELDFDSTNIMALPEGGMGLSIIKMVADDVDYERGAVNRLTIVRDFRRAETA